MVYKKPEERLGDLDERIKQIEAEKNQKIKQLEAQKKQLEAKIKDKERKERTRKLIQIGAIFGKLGIDEIDIAEHVTNHFLSNQKSKEWLENYISKFKNKETQNNEQQV